ncbi:MAG: hypothetical protein QXD32_05745 [Nitrososphaerota archaeon]
MAQNGVVPSLSIDAMPAMVEVNLSKPMMHDVYLPRNDEPVPIKNVLDRVGEPVVRCPWKKIAAIIVTDKPESGAGAYGGVGSVELNIAGCETEILG